jgi:hypothetical protein
MQNLNSLSRWLFWLQLGGAIIACDGAGAEASALYILIVILTACASGLACGWTAYLEGYRAGEQSKGATNDQ